MADPHFTRICQVCETLYQATKTKSGKPRKTKYQVCSVACRSLYIARNPSEVAHSARMISKPCEWCGHVMTLTPYIAKTRTTCSRSCRQNLRVHTEGKTHRPRGFYCAGCKRHTNRKRGSKDAAKFCSRECSFDMLTLLKKETSALQRIGQGQRLRVESTRKEMVEPEVRALLRIAAGIRIRTTSCLGCGRSHIRRRKFSRFCTEICRERHQCNSRELHRKSEAGRRTKRIAKSKRRALLRATQVESIDPIDVFNRDKWVCHLCKKKTLKSKRGTCDDRAPELEHIVSLSNGGTHTWGNVSCSCRKCNHEKGAKDLGQIGMDIAC